MNGKSLTELIWKKRKPRPALELRGANMKRQLRMDNFMGFKVGGLDENAEKFIREKKQCPFCTTGGVHEGRPRHVPLIDLQVETLESYQCQICKRVFIIDGPEAEEEPNET